MKQLITGFHHVALKCRGDEEFERCVAFYRDVLGLRVAREWGGGARRAVMLDTGAGIFEIFSDGSEEGREGAWRHLALCCSDPDACIEAVRAAGYFVKTEPTDICIPSDPPYPARIAFCIGPVGEEIEFFSPQS